MAPLSKLFRRHDGKNIALVVKHFEPVEKRLMFVPYQLKFNLPGFGSHGGPKISRWGS